MSGIRRSDNSDEAEAFCYGRTNEERRMQAERQAFALLRDAIQAMRVALRTLTPARPTPTQRRLAEEAAERIEKAADALAALSGGPEDGGGPALAVGGAVARVKRGEGG